MSNELVPFGRGEPADLRLPSRSTPAPGKEGRQLRRQEAYELAVERTRRNIQIARIHGTTEVAAEAIRSIAMVNKVAEAAAAALPRERDRSDVIADTAAALMQRLVAEMGE